MRRALLFFGLFILTVVLLTMRFNAMYPDYSARQFHEVFHADHPAETIVIGSSTAVHGYDPSIIGSDFFNFGLMGAQPHFYREWYQIFKRYYPAPKTVIVSLDWFSGGANRANIQGNDLTLVENSRYLSFHVLVPLFWQANMSDKGKMLTNMIRILGIGPDIKYFFVHRNDSAMAGYDRGYMPLDGSIDLSQHMQRTFTASGAFLTDLAALLDDIQAQGSRVILVQMPIYQPHTITNLDGSVFQKIATERGIPYLDYNAEHASALNEDAAMFGDWSHLNREGSRVFSTQFRHDIAPLLQR